MRPSRWMVCMVVCLFSAATLAQAADVRKRGINDYSSFNITYPAGNVVNGVQPVDIRVYGANLSTTNGTDDWAAAINEAVDAVATAGGGIIVFPAGTFNVTATITLNANVILTGMGKWATKILKGFNGTLMTMGDGSGLEHIWLDGNGSSYTGKAVSISGTDGRQSVINARINNCEDYCISFEATTAGSQSYFANMETYRTDLAGAGKYAVYIPNEEQAEAVPRVFHGIETSGGRFIDLGGAADLFITGGYVGEIKFRSESCGVHIVGTRYAGLEMWEILGYNNVITGCDIYPDVTIMPGAQKITMQGNTHNGTVYDKAVHPTNLVDIAPRSYTPLLTTNGTAPDVGNAINRGRFSREGNTCTVCIDFTFGSTTSFGSGDVAWSLPTECGFTTDYIQAAPGFGYINTSSPPNVRTALFRALPADNTLRFFFDGAVVGVTAMHPVTFANGDVIRGCVTYMQ